MCHAISFYRQHGRAPALASLALLAAIKILALSAASTGPAPALPKGPEVLIHAEPDKATIGDPIRIELDLTLPKGYQVSLPQLGNQIGDFSVLELYPGPAVPDLKPAGPRQPSKRTEPAANDETFHHRIRIVAAIYKTGEFTFPSLALSLRDPAGKETPLPTPTAKVVIQSLLAAQDQQLKDLKRQAEIPEPVRWLWWLALGLAALALGVVAWWFYRRRKRALVTPLGTPQLDPFQLAEAELRDLLGRDLLEKHRIKHFYVALSDIVKKILEAGYGIPAVEKTTDEVIEALKTETSTPSGSDGLRCIESFLTLCDFVKFARSIPSNAENEETVQRAFRILEMGRNRRAASATADAAHLKGDA